MPTRVSIMTYNVHSCIGSDGTASPARIAEVIALYGADIICLQELDIRLLRSGGEDQAREIADRLNMEFHFYPSLRLEEEGEYGNAVLTRFPLRAIKAGELPTLPGRRDVEQRGALWVKVTVGGRDLNIITTHLGLSRQERLAQTEELLGPAWTGSVECRPPIILCGDMNALRFSRVYRRFAAAFVDACGGKIWKAAKTWHSRFPLLRIDHVFLSPDVTVEKLVVPRTKLTRLASDHLPVVAVVTVN